MQAVYGCRFSCMAEELVVKAEADGDVAKSFPVLRQVHS